MFALRVDMPNLIDGRLNAEAYAPTILADRAAMRASGLRVSALADVVRAPINNSIRDVTDVLDVPGASVPMYRPADISDGWCDDTTAPRLPAHFEAEHAKSRVIPGDIVLGIAGSIAIAGRVPPSTLVGNVNGSSARIAPKRGQEGYLLSFLNSRYGQSAMLQWAVGAVQRHLNLEDLPAVDVVEPCHEAQHYIGSKVRQAEALRDWARTSEAAFRSAVGIDVPHSTGRGRHSRVRSADLDADLNPGRFTPDRLEVRRALTRNGARLVESFATIAADNTASPAARSRYLGLDCISSTSIDVKLQSVESANVSGTCRVLPRGAAISKLRPYLNKAVFVPGGMGPVVGSTELLCVGSHSVHAGFVYGVLKLDTTVRQLNSVASGATHPRVGADEVLDLLVPWHDEHERLGRSLERAQQAYFGARSLVTAARVLVEALIERKVSEAELMTASNNPRADRTLLARLHDDGVDGTGAPLFPDLDALAELLAEAAR
jgi:type I restriction enzyme S subunit